MVGATSARKSTERNVSDETKSIRVDGLAVDEDVVVEAAARARVGVTRDAADESVAAAPA